MLQRFITKLTFFSIFFLIYSAQISSSIQEKFCNLYIPHASFDFRFPDNSKISPKNSSSYFLFTMKWQQKINRAFLKFFEDLQSSLDISIEDIYNMLSNETIVEEFKEYLNEKLTLLLSDPKTLTEETMNPYLRNTLQKGIEKFILEKNITFITNPNIHNLVDIYFDITKNMYVICFNANVYNLETIRNINASVHRKKSYYFYYKLSEHKINYLLYNEFINSGFIVASSFIHHQHSLILFILINYKFSGKMANYNTIMLLKRLMSFQTDIEIILQSSNPLETAYFYKELDSFKAHTDIWQLIINDITNMYNTESLLKFKKIREATQKNL